MLAMVFSLLLLSAPSAFADEPPPAGDCCDALAIQWVLPGHFGEALARAKREHRILVIKGVSFGIDAAGARCATKGQW